MPGSGGSATVNGILYQVLGTLGLATTQTLRAAVADGDVSHAILVIEPQHGGDVQVVSPHGIVVEQWKSKTGGGPWSLAQVIDEVLPDLFLATTKRASSYRFVTEGHVGTWGKAYDFFRGLGSPPADADLLDKLDDREAVQFAKGEETTRRELFLRVAKAVARRRNASGLRADELHQRVWHLLSRFEVVPKRDLAGLVKDLNGQLRAVVDFNEEVDGKRRELCGRVLELASKGDSPISPEELLKSVGLSIQSFLAWDALRQAMRVRLDRRLLQSGIDLAFDVRAASIPQPQRPITIITGESGQGKTWALASSASAAASGPALVVWVSAERANRSVDQIVAEEVCLKGLQRGQVAGLDALARQCAEVNPNVPRPWAVVYVDGVNTRDDAAYLASLDWESWNIRLVVSALPEVADHFKAVCPTDRIEIASVGDFTPPELRAYLQRRGNVWTNIPHDVRDLVRRPILAKLFSDLAQDSTWIPRREYDLMEAYWQRIRKHGSGEAIDLAHLRGLGDELLAEKPVYPWSQEVLKRVGIGPEEFRRLQRSGWLREMENGAAEIWHDRLMCWTVAESLAERCGSGQLRIEDLTKLLKNWNDRNDRWALRLAYMPLDVLWLLVSPQMTHDVRAEAWQVIQALETHGGYGHQSVEMYEKVLPTLGGRIVPAVVERVRRNKAKEHCPIARLAAECCLAIADRDPDVVREQIAGCIGDDQENVRELGLRLLAKFPEARHMRRVWAVHSASDRSEDSSGARSYLRHKVEFAAAAACFGEEPEWLEQQVKAGLSGQSLATAVALLASNEGDRCRQVWNRLKSQLFELVPADNRNCLVFCILRFRDRDELDRLVAWIQEGDRVLAPTALAVFTLFDPERAALILGTVPPDCLWLPRNVQDVLASTSPDDLARAVEQLVTTNAAEPFWAYNLLASTGDRIGSNAINSLIDNVDAMLGEYLQASTEQGKNRLHRPIERLAELFGPKVLHELQHRVGSRFEDRLAEAGCRWADDNSGVVDHLFDAVCRLLRRMGGPGVTRVVNAQLSAKSKYARLSGCLTAPIRPDDETRRLLSALTLSAELWEGGGNPFPLVQQKAITALAEVGAGAELVQGIMRWGTFVSPDVSEARRNQVSLSDRDIEPALRALEQLPAEQISGALLALGSSGRTDLRDRIKKLFGESDVESKVALTSMLALEDLGGRDRDIDERLLAQYKSGKHKFAALKLLCTGDEDSSVLLLSQAIPPTGAFDDCDRRIIAYFVGNKKVQHLLDPQVRESLRGDFAYSVGIDPASLMDVHDPRDERQLWDAASKPIGGWWVRGTKAGAIEQLAQLHPDAAFDLAERSILDGESSRENLFGVALRLDPTRAVPLLIRHAVNANNRLLCRTLALKLRGAHREAAAIQLRRWFESDEWLVRRAAICIAGYLGVDVLRPELERSVRSDGQFEVCCAGAAAIRRQQREAAAAELIPAFAAAQGANQWAIGEEILGLGDPGELRAKEDPIGFLPVLRAKSYPVRKYFIELLKKNDEKLEKDLDSLMHKWKDE